MLAAAVLPAITVDPNEFDRGLNEHVRNGEHRALHARRQADTHHAEKLIFIDMQLMQLQTVRSVRFHQADGHKSRRNHLRNDRRNGNTRHAEMEHNDEEQIQNDVYNAAMVKKYSGRFVSPTERKIAAPKLYSIIAGMPTKYMRM